MSAPRKNGQLSSCEPCRRSKLRCDHSIPVCRRCTRKGKSHLCVYHPAPLTQAGRSNQTARSEYSPDSVPITPRSAEDVLQDQPFENWHEKKALFSTPGSLGLTSYSSVFSEHEDTFDRPLHNIPDTSNVSVKAIRDSPRIRLGARLLLLFEDLTLYEAIAETWWQMSAEGCVIGPALVRGIFSSLKAMYEAWTKDTKDAGDRYSQMLSWSLKIFENTRKPINVHPSMTVEEYVFAISNRWESVGLVFSVIGLGAILSSAWRTTFERHGKDPPNQKNLGVLAAAAGDASLQFCDYCGIVTDPLSWLLSQNIHLLTLIYGDNDSRPWRKLADLNTVIFTLGLNQSKQDARIPFFLAELRKRVMGNAYSIDKQLATFLGRPPQISWRYCDIQPPLDLSYDEIMSPPDVRESTLGKLDANGWNKEGKITNTAWIRVALCMGPIREQIIELCLSRHMNDIPVKVKELSESSHRIWNDLPEFLRSSPDPGKEDDDRDLLRLSLYLDYLYNDFLLYRILFKRTQTGSHDLIRISSDILNVLLILMGKNIRARNAKYNVSWNLCYCGIPSAGVLAIELLQRSQMRSQSINTAPPALQDPFRRSEVIQNLSIFASYLQSAIQPHEGNYDICQHARNVIRQILDRVLLADDDSNNHDVPPLPFPLTDTAIAVDWFSVEGIPMEDGTLDFLGWMDQSDIGD